jgi:hypothetical protein
MKAKINQFLDAMTIPVGVLMIGFLVLYLMFSEEIHKDKEEMKTHRKFREENFVCCASATREQCKTLCLK